MRALVRGLLSDVERSIFKFKHFGQGSIIKPWPRGIRGAQYISIGDDCFFGDGLLLAAVDNYAGRSHTPSCVFGNSCVFGSDAVISCTNSIVIEDNVLTSLRVFIGDSYHGYADASTPVLHQPMSGEAPIRIGAGSFLGIGCAILPGTTLGKGCVVGANAVVKGVFEDHSVIVGVPGRVVRRYDPTQAQWV